MTPAARTQAAIEILDLVIAAAHDNGAAADTIIAGWFKARRFAGSGDRRAIRELVYRAIRSFGDPPKSGRAALITLADAEPELAATFDGSQYGPAIIDPKEQRVPSDPVAHAIVDQMPDFIDARECAAMLERATLDLRVNLAKKAPLNLPESARIDGLPHGLRLPVAMHIEQHEAYLAGLIEIQDAASQCVALACKARPGETVVDLCAGGGGKTLALAADMGGKGRLIASDTARDRLAGLAPRAARAGISFIETRLLNPNRELETLGDLQAAADLVLVDAPCSGTGTWRRNPEARWRLTEDRLLRLAALQAHVLHLGSELVKPGGRLVYAVCSLLDREGKDQVDRFLAGNAEWHAEPPAIQQGRVHGLGRMLTPFHDETDGFFVATLARSC